MSGRAAGVVLLGVLLAGCATSGPAPAPSVEAEAPSVEAGKAPADQPVEAQGKTRLERLTEAMAPYIEQARATWPPARARYLAGLPAGTILFATVQLRDGAGRMEQVFVQVDGIEADRIRGVIWNDIQRVSGYAKGQRYEFPESELIDWTIANPDGTEEGNVVGTFLDTWDWNAP